jgi:hypothetical protein
VSPPLLSRSIGRAVADIGRGLNPSTNSMIGTGWSHLQTFRRRLFKALVKSGCRQLGGVSATARCNSSTTLPAKIDFRQQLGLTSGTSGRTHGVTLKIRPTLSFQQEQ